MSLFTGVYQINVRVKEIKKAVEWYEEILGLRVLKDYGKTVVLEHEGGVPVCLIEKSTHTELPDNLEGTHPVFSISPTSVEACRKTLVNRSVVVLEGGSEGHFKFRDLDGNLLEAYVPGLYQEDRFKSYR
ncbi:VOC family protein [Halobacillus sp. HZG1]|uniref:VOC family protein n=1 Tax=Halobacillus sp. HZG1 TaxID=3111769 RepID=UPI002DBB5848|nr:VOC family protein [Halobacillus sp. HZG1]MEC3885372.1 VOC family protein [Halobacillus sp. HZG1]